MVIHQEDQNNLIEAINDETIVIEDKLLEFETAVHSGLGIIRATV